MLCKQENVSYDLVESRSRSQTNEKWSEGYDKDGMRSTPISSPEGNSRRLVMVK